MTKNKTDESLYKDILNRFYKGNIDKMYEHFSMKIQYLEAYGDTKEKRLINYCTYKSDMVKQLYKI